jgi:hypothetical protein
MNRDKFIQYLESPETLDNENLNEISGVLGEYPYFQTAHMLLVKTLHNLHDLKFNNQLKVSAAYIGNRNILFNLVNQSAVKQRPDETTGHDSSPVGAASQVVAEDKAIEAAGTLTIDGINGDLPVDEVEVPSILPDDVADTQLVDEAADFRPDDAIPGTAEADEASVDVKTGEMQEKVAEAGVEEIAGALPPDEIDVQPVDLAVTLPVDETAGILPLGVAGTPPVDEIIGTVEADEGAVDVKPGDLPEQDTNNKIADGAETIAETGESQVTESGEEIDECLADRILREVALLKESRSAQLEQEGKEDVEIEKIREELLREQGERIRHEDPDPAVENEQSEIAVEEGEIITTNADVLLIDETSFIPESTVGPSQVIGEEDSVIHKYDQDLLELDKNENIDSGQPEQHDPDPVSDQKKKEINLPLNPGSESHSFSDWLDLLQTAPAAEDYPDDKSTLTGQEGEPDLIDRFLKEKPRIEPRSPLEIIEPPVDMSAVSSRENDEFFTETLAKIYIQQKHYKQAIYAYEKLCLRFPEKYSYFASQISEIKRLINH